jgi:hypothetical protein
MILTVLLLTVTSFSFLGSMEYSAHGKKDFDQSQVSKQNSKCEAGEDNNNSCNNISIARRDGGGSDNDGGNQVQVSKQNSKCEAGEDNNNSCNNFDLKEHDGGGSGSANNGGGNDGGNQVQVSKQNSKCEAGEDNNNSCNNFDLKEMISDGLKMLRQT